MTATVQNIEEQFRDLAVNSSELAWNFIADAMTNRLYWFARHHVYDHSSAEEIVQESFARALLEKRFFDNDFKPVSWLYRVTLNQCMSTKRKAAIFLKHFRILAYDTQSTPDPLDEVVNRENTERLHNSLNKLPAKLKSAMLLTYCEEMNADEVAECLCIPVGTVYSRIHKGRQIILKELNHEKK